MKVRYGTFAALAGAVALVFAAAPASAQVCAGMPTAPGQTSIGARASFPTGGTQFGIEAGRNWNNPLGVFVNLNLLMPEDDNEDNVAVIGGGFAYEVGDFIPAVPAWLSICPLVAVAVTTGDATRFDIPVGVGFGTRIAANGFEILPFVIPQFVITRVSVDGVTFSDNNFDIGFGGYAKFSGVYGGVTLNRVFMDETDTAITFHAGLVFPARLP
jgi:hypothetical protein